MAQNKSVFIKMAIKQRCVPEADWALSKFERWFYTAKAIICVAFNRGTGHTTDEKIEVAHFNEHWGSGMDCSPDWNWEALAVGRGLLKGWWVGTFLDGSC